MKTFHQIPIFLFGMVATIMVVAAEKKETTTSVGFGAHSQYLTDGFNDLAHGGYYSLEATITKGPLSFGFWGASGTAVDYEEANLGIAYEWALGAFEGSVAYTWLGFYEQDSNSDDTEVGLTWAHTEWRWLPAVEWLYSSQSNGHKAVLIWEHAMEREQDTITPYAQLGFDFAYLTEEYDGANHLSIGGVWQRRLSESWQARLELAHIWGLGNMNRADEPDRLWGSLSLIGDF